MSAITTPTEPIPAIARILVSDQPPHAVLLYGQEGCGQLGQAYILAKAWLCPKAGPHGACSECSVCLSFDSVRCVDFQHVKPHGPSNLILNGDIVPDPTRDPPPTVPVTEYFRTSPLMGRHKVVLIEQAERMNPYAASALLKTLEEPHDFARLILTTNALGSMTPTIRSRCLLIACPGGDLPEGLNALEARMVAAFADGSPDIAQRVLASPESYGKLLELFDRLESSPPAAALKHAESLRAIADDLVKEASLGSRVADSEVLRAFAAWSRNFGWAEATLTIVGAHRRTVGNGNFGLITDALFVRLSTSDR